MWPRSYLLQVGDSRCYIFWGGRLTQISRDQTMAQALVDQGVLTHTRAHSTRWAHVLASAIGEPPALPTSVPPTIPPLPTPTGNIVVPSALPSGTPIGSIEPGTGTAIGQRAPARRASRQGHEVCLGVAHLEVHTEQGERPSAARHLDVIHGRHGRDPP